MEINGYIMEIMMETLKHSVAEGNEQFFEKEKNEITKFNEAKKISCPLILILILIVRARLNMFDHFLRVRERSEITKAI